MPAQSPLRHSDTTAPAPMSRRERRGKRTEQQSIPGFKLPAQGSQNTPPARKHNNYRRG
ncbi:hypothetical protein K7711_34725 [Nocardia sp. CA2R105]|uniref:hypothetical protein n=1 Tax=Nocardia coffeae TaxID=2873381 RepID=UPI001CA7B1EF|nr:hypothetical protein [Nocardia coffeae]MBY8861674.1 hypothetical protein [Nocardia coffeae]